MRAAAVASTVVGAVIVSALAVGCSAGVEEPRRASTGLSGSTVDRSPGAGDPAAGTLQEESPGTEAWRITRQSRHHEIEAFSTHVSGVPGTRVGLKVSTTAAHYTVTAYRIGDYQGGTGTRVWESGRQPGRVQPQPVFSPAETRTVVAPWRRDLSIDTTDWEPGFHVLTLRTRGGWETLVPYVVSSPSAAGTVALVAPVTTWQAYNEWGGYSLYAGPDGDRRAWAVSFDRPYNGATGANDYRSAAIPIIVRAERTGEPLSYFTNVDLHTRPGALAGARGYVSMGHDEYWTTAMRQQVMTARDAGTNLAFLGANTMYWRIRLEDRPNGAARVVVGYRDSAHLDPQRDRHPSEVTARFRDAPVPRPEHDLVGMQYECYPVDTDYVVVSPRWWGFRGTGVGQGEHVPGLVGPEADRVYPDATLPSPLQVLSHTEYGCRGVTTSSQSVYYTTSSGAGVFTAGTLRWGCAMVNRCERPLPRRTSSFVDVVTGNLIRGFAAGPVGARYPARDNVDRFGLSGQNWVSAS